MTANERADLAVIAEIVRRIETRQEADAAERETIADNVRALNVKTADHERRITVVEPVTAMVTGWQARMMGAAIVLGFFGTVAGAGWMMMRDKLGAIWAAFWGA
jgi:hypothetical protein